MEVENQFAAADYAVFGSTIALSLLIGIAASCRGSKDKSPDEFLVGNRRLAVVPVAISMLMSGVSASQLLGTTAEMYFFGTQNFMETMGRLLVYPIPILLIVPIFYPLKLTSLLQYFKLRYDSDVLHIFSVVIFVSSSILSNGIQLFGPSTSFEAVTGIDYRYCIAATGLVVIIYTTMGGIRSVVWTDVFQGLILISGLMIILGVGASKVGGLDRVWEICDEGGRIKFFDMNPDPTERMTFWTAVTGGAATTIMYTAIGQTSVQRYSSVSSMRKGMCIFAINIPVSVLVEVLISLTGLTIYAYFVDCDPLVGNKISNANQVLPYFMINVLDTPGLPGLFLAVIFCACLSTNSTQLNGNSAIMYKGIFEPCLNKIGASEYKKLIFLKGLACSFGLCVTAVAFGIPYLDGHVIQLSTTLLGGTYGPLAGCTFLGLFVPFAQWKGAIAGMFCGVGFTTWIAIAKQMGDDVTPHMLPLVYNQTVCDVPSQSDGVTFGDASTYGYTQWMTVSGGTTDTAATEEDSQMFALYRISFMYMSVMAFSVTFLTGMIFSLLTGPAKPGDINPNTMVNWSNTVFFRYMSPGRRHKFMCGYDKVEEQWEIIHGKESKVDEVKMADQKNLDVKDSTTGEKDMDVKDPSAGEKDMNIKDPSEGSTDFKESCGLGFLNHTAISPVTISKSNCITRL